MLRYHRLVGNKMLPHFSTSSKYFDIHNFGQFRHAEFDKNTFIDIWYHLKVPQACW